MDPKVHSWLDAGRPFEPSATGLGRAAKYRWAILPLLLLLLVGGTAGAFWQLRHLEQRQYQELPLQGAEMQALTMEAFRQAYTESVVERVRPNGIKVAHDYYTTTGAIPLPATLTMEVGERVQKNRPGAHVRLYSDYPFPWRKDGGPRDDFEQEALRALRQNPDQPFHRFEEFEGRPSLRYAVAERMRMGCVSCHNSHPDSPKRDWRVGDVRGVLEIVRPLDAAVAENRASLHRALLLCTGMSGLGVTGLLVVSWQFARSQRAAERSERKLRTIVETAGDSILIADSTRRIVSVNRQIERMFGYHRDELLGKEVEILIPERLREGHRKHFDRYLLIPHIRLMRMSMMQLGRRKDGSEFPVQISLSPVPLSEGMLVCAIIRDLTEIKRNEDALRATLLENTQLVESIPSILIELDEANCIRKWNKVAERTFGRRAEEVQGQSFDKAGISFLDDALSKGLETCRRNQRSVEIENISFCRLDGTVGQLRVSLAPVNNTEMNSSGILVLAEDVTERRQLESQLAHAQKMESIGQLAAGVAHEINTPIQYIGDNATFLRDAFADLTRFLPQFEKLVATLKTGSVTPEVLHEAERAYAQANAPYLCAEIPQAIQQTLEGVNNVAGIVRALKEFSHPVCDEKTAIDINHAIENTLTVARNEWKYVADVVTKLDPSLPPVPCLPGEINQVLLNVIVNAAHAINDRVDKKEIARGTITVSTSRANGYARILIGDNGGGVPEKIRSRIFDPFFTTKPLGKGTGQGLAIAHTVVVKKHRGQLTFETEEGKGTTFQILLPLEETPPKEGQS